MHWAKAAPDRVFMAERPSYPPPLAGEGREGPWRTITYAQMLDRVRRIGAALLTRNLSADRPIVILSGNDLEHALLGLAANYVGIPYAPVSPAYSLISSDFGKLKHIVDLLTPGLVYACNAQYERALQSAVPRETEVIIGALDALDAAPQAADAAHARVTPDTIAKFLFTSGSTGMPKGVINTQRMWCSNQAMIGSALQFFADEPPVIVDWAPWHHTAGGNHDVGLVLHNGGTLYIDGGKPLPGAIDETVRNLKEIAPTWYFTVPKGYEALLPFFRADAALREKFFSRLKVLWFAGAGLAQHVFDEWKEMAQRTCGEQILFLTGLGSTETAPYAFGRMWDTENATNIGLPPPGLDVKLVPLSDGKYEVRLKGPNITPGYWRDDKLTADAFDEEDFYKLGDALRFDDPAPAGEGPAVRRPHRRGLQARDRHVGERRAAARVVHRALRALCARRRDRGRGPRSSRRAHFPRSRRLPPPRARAERRARGRHRGARQCARRIPPPAGKLRPRRDRLVQPHHPRHPG